MAGLYNGMVEIVLGPVDNKVKLRSLNSGTPYGQDSAEECCNRMLEIADEHSAQPDIFAKHSTLRTSEGFTTDQFREYVATAPTKLIYKITQGKFGPGLSVFEEDETFEGRKAKTLVF